MKKSKSILEIPELVVQVINENQKAVAESEKLIKAYLASGDNESVDELLEKRDAYVKGIAGLIKGSQFLDMLRYWTPSAADDVPNLTLEHCVAATGLPESITAKATEQGIIKGRYDEEQETTYYSFNELRRFFLWANKIEG